MSRTLGPVLALGAVTVVNQTVFNNKPMDWRVPTALAAVATSFAERAAPEITVILVWTSLLTVLLTRINNVPSPVESAVSWWNKSKG